MVIFFSISVGRENRPTEIENLFGIGVLGFVMLIIAGFLTTKGTKGTKKMRFQVVCANHYKMCFL